MCVSHSHEKAILVIGDTCCCIYNDNKNNKTKVYIACHCRMNSAVLNVLVMKEEKFSTVSEKVSYVITALNEGHVCGQARVKI